MVIAMPDARESVSAALAESHVVLPQGLRADTLIFVFIRKDIWLSVVEEDNK